MAIYVKGALGSFSGKLGNVVGSNWRSIDYLRSLPKPSKKAATAMQQAQRVKFTLAVNFLAPLRELINIGFNDKSQRKMTAFNQATNNLIAKIEGSYPDFSIPYDQVQLSKGSLSRIILTTDVGMEGNVSFTWPTAGDSLTGKADDVVSIILYSEERNDYYVFQDAIRGDGSYEVSSEFIPAGDYQVWQMLISADGKRRSNSEHSGTLTV